jgi:hypothetical protein
MSSGGGGPLKQAQEGLDNTFKKWKNDPLGEFGKAITNYATLGYGKFDREGLRAGTTLSNLDEFIGEFSGRNKARAAQRRADEQIAAAEKEQREEFARARLREYQSDLTASRAAGSSGASGGARSYGVLRTPIGDSKKADRDFLGL